MNEVKVDWDQNQFKAYLLIYAANSNFAETEEEKEVILSKVDPDTYKKMHREYEHDNDYQRLQKILAAIEKFGYSKEDLSQLREEIRQVLNSEGYHDELEENMFLYLKKILS
jgi:hypothetical protein